MNKQRKSYPSDVSDEEWAFCVRYLALMTEAAPQRVYPLREIFNALRYLVKTRGAWRMMPHDLPPWHVVYQQMQRWIFNESWVFERERPDIPFRVCADFLAVKDLKFDAVPKNPYSILLSPFFLTEIIHSILRSIVPQEDGIWSESPRPSINSALVPVSRYRTWEPVNVAVAYLYDILSRQRKARRPRKKEIPDKTTCPDHRMVIFPRSN